MDNQQELNRTKGVVQMKAIKNYENLYSVTTDGRVYSHISNRFLKPQLLNNGYYTVSLCSADTKTSVYIHRIVAETYVENPYNLNVVNHKDGDKLNNNIGNLEWTNHSGNLNHAYQSGYGFRDTNRKYDDTFCSKVFTYLIDGWRQKDIADALGVTVCVIKSILCNPAYEDIRSEFDLNKIPSRSNRVTPERVMMIASDLESGMSQNKIATKYNVAKSLVSNIKTRKKYSTLTSDFNF